MAIKSSPSIYESLASILLPEGILYLFEVTQDEEYTGQPDEIGTEVCIIHIYHDKCDLRNEPVNLLLRAEYGWTIRF